jgi:large subunit ribosomal protein L18
MSFNRKEQRALRHRRLRQRIKGTAARPRMAICISNKHMYVQFIDDDAQCTLAATSTLKADEACKCNIETAKLVGEQAASAAKEKGISLVVVDRGGSKFHGRIKQIVDSAVAAGLKITEKVAKEVAEETK